VRNVKKDTESLIEHRNSSSFYSLSTDTGSRLSFYSLSADTGSSVERQVRNPSQDSTLPDRTPHKNSSEEVPSGSQRVIMQPPSSAKSGKRSWAERWQRATGGLDKIRARPKGTLLLLGASSSGSAALMTLLAISHQEGPSFDQLGRYRPAIYRAVIDDVKLLLENLRGLHSELISDLDTDTFQTVLHYDTSAPIHHMNAHLLAALTTLWDLPDLLAALEQSEGAFPENAL
jgi:hypothetical protein